MRCFNCIRICISIFICISFNSFNLYPPIPHYLNLTFSNSWKSFYTHTAKAIFSEVISRTSHHTSFTTNHLTVQSRHIFAHNFSSITFHHLPLRAINRLIVFPFHPFPVLQSTPFEQSFHSTRTCCDFSLQVNRISFKSSKSRT